MNPGAFVRALFVCLAVPIWCAAADSSVPVKKEGPPKSILEDVASWQKQSGTWELTATSAKGSTTDTLAELSAARGIRMTERWLSFKVSLTGEAVKAGVLFAGVQDQRGDILRLSVEQATESLTNGRGKLYASLAPLPASVDLIVKFGAEKVLVFHREAQVAEIPVKYAEDQATLSWFVERGTAVFSEALLGSLPAANALAVTPNAPARRGGARAMKVERLSLDFPDAIPVALKGDWNDYFAVHFETAQGPWKMVRHFDGPEFGYPAKGPRTGEVRKFDGPFASQPVEVSLAEYRDWKRKDARGLDENLKTLIEQDRSALFIVPWVASFSPLQKDAAWALMKALYGANIGAEGRVYFQWGDDINFRRLGTVENSKSFISAPRGGASPARGANQAEDIAAYAENFFAPAVEVMRRASEEIFHDQRRIPILIGSCAKASQAVNREWFAKVLDYEIGGAFAPALKGRKVIELVDYLTVNYPFQGARDASALQELWQKYGSKVKGLWVTEEFGSTSRSSSVFLERMVLFLEWAATNQLDAQQTRLFWNLPGHGGENGNDLPRKLGAVFGGSPLRISRIDAGTSRLYRITGNDGQMLYVHLPSGEKRGKRIGQQLELTPPQGLDERVWEATWIASKDRQNFAGVAVPVDRKDGKLVPAIDANAAETWALLMVVK